MSSCYDSSSDYTSSASTIDALTEVRPRCSKPSNCNNRSKCCSPRDDCSNSKYDPGVAYFTSMVTPLSDVVPAYSETPGLVEFRMRRRNMTVILQWEPFSALMAAAGVAYLTVNQGICNLPPYSITQPVTIEYKGVIRQTFVEIDPTARTGNIRFYLNADGSSTDVAVGDAVSIRGGTANWIVN